MSDANKVDKEPTYTLLKKCFQLEDYLNDLIQRAKQDKTIKIEGEPVDYRPE